MRKFLVSAGICLVFALTTALQGATINVGNHILEPDTPGQRIFIYGDGGEPLQGIQLAMKIQTTNGEGPIITELTMAGQDSGTLFGANASVPQIFSFPGDPRTWAGDLVTLSGTIPLTPNLPIAIVTVDTTGVFAGPSTKTFTLNFNPPEQPSFYLSPLGDGAFRLFPIGSLQGTLSIRAVPEPSTMVLAAMAGLALVYVGGRRKYGK